MAVLYRDLYLGKYSPLNPQYNADYFTLTLKEGFLTYRAFVEDGRLDAFVSYFVEDELMTSSLLAHDRNRPRKLSALPSDLRAFDRRSREAEGAAEHERGGRGFQIVSRRPVGTGIRRRLRSSPAGSSAPAVGHRQPHDATRPASAMITAARRIP